MESGDTPEAKTTSKRKNTMQKAKNRLLYCPLGLVPSLEGAGARVGREDLAAF